MAQVTSQVPAVLAYLVGLFTAALGAGSPAVSVYDGPATTADAPGLVLWVGLDDPDSDTAPLAAESERTYGTSLAGAGETITIHCTAEAWTGQDSIPVARASAYGIASAVDTLLRADRGLTAQTGLIYDPAASGVAELRQNNTQGGQARITFTIVLKSY